jgi:hypothetical protein
MTTLIDLKLIESLLEQWHRKIMKIHLKLTRMRRGGTARGFITGRFAPSNQEDKGVVSSFSALVYSPGVIVSGKW